MGAFTREKHKWQSPWKGYTLNTHLKGKRVFVTGACGTIGRELIRQLLEEYEVGEIVGIDNNESDLFFLAQKFSAPVPIRR